jgi:hypothetical protein
VSILSAAEKGDELAPLHSITSSINRVWPITDQATGGDYAPSWRIGADGLRFAHPPYELLRKSIHAQYRSIAPRLGNEAR